MRSSRVNAPVIDEFPVAMECELAEVVETETMYCIVGRIVNVAAEESVLSENGKVDPKKLNALIFDQFQNGYYVTGEQVGRRTHWPKQNNPHQLALKPCNRQNATQRAIISAERRSHITSSARNTIKKKEP